MRQGKKTISYIIIIVRIHKTFYIRQSNIKLLSINVIKKYFHILSA